MIEQNALRKTIRETTRLLCQRAATKKDAAEIAKSLHAEVEAGLAICVAAFEQPGRKWAPPAAAAPKREKRKGEQEDAT